MRHLVPCLCGNCRRTWHNGAQAVATHVWFVQRLLHASWLLRVTFSIPTFRRPIADHPFSKFWHQLLRWPFQDISSYVSRQVLGLPHPSLLERYVNISIVFFLSGTLHSFLDVAYGMQWNLSGGVYCFLIMVLGIILEDGVQWLWRNVQPLQETGTKDVRWFEMAIGYVWVWLWMVAVTPVYNYPLQRIENNPTYVLPWSGVKHFK